MCVIIISPVGTGINHETMKMAIERNPHGWGFTAIDRNDDGTGTVVVKWGEGIDTAWNLWRKYSKMERIFHARVSTSGKITRENQHPFNVTDSNGVERWFYHNGMIRDIPELNEDMCDSWHMSKIITAIPTTKKLTSKLQDSAYKNNSRYVLAAIDETYYFGRGWLSRDGVIYSNASALGEGKVGGSRAAAKGGEFDNKEIEITCPEHVEGFGYDAKRKIYSSHIEAPPKPVYPVYATASPYKDYNQYGTGDYKQHFLEGTGKTNLYPEKKISTDGHSYQSRLDSYQDIFSNIENDEPEDRITKGPYIRKEIMSGLIKKAVEIKAIIGKAENFVHILENVYVSRREYENAVDAELDFREIERKESLEKDLQPVPS